MVQSMLSMLLNPPEVAPPNGRVVRSLAIDSGEIPETAVTKGRGKSRAEVAKAYRDNNREAVAAAKARCKAKNAEKYRATAAAYREKNREALREKSRAYAAANGPEIAARKRANRLANIEHIKARDAAYYQANRETILAKQRAARRAKRESA